MATVYHLENVLGAVFLGRPRTKGRDCPGGGIETPEAGSLRPRRPGSRRLSDASDLRRRPSPHAIRTLLGHASLMRKGAVSLGEDFGVGISKPLPVTAGSAGAASSAGNRRESRDETKAGLFGGPFFCAGARAHE